MKDARNQEERTLASELAFVFLSARSDLLDRLLHLLRGLARLPLSYWHLDLPRFDGRLRAWD
jgi:hypothetical protein